MNFKKKSTIINGQKIFYWEKNKGKKESIILLHGFPGNHKGLISLANGLENYHLIIPDMPACGLSEPLKEICNLENYSTWLNDFMDFLSINKIIIIGHSFGSRVALVFSNNYPTKVKKLVLITPVVKIEGLIARFVAIEYEIAKILPQNLKKMWLSNRLHRDIGHMIVFKTASTKRREKLIARDNKELKKFDPQTNIELFDEFYRFSLVPIGKKIKTKALIIAGELDEIAPLDSVKELAMQLTDSKLIIMKGCGHVVVVEKPLTTATIIRNWLK